MWKAGRLFNFCALHIALFGYYDLWLSLLCTGTFHPAGPQVSSSWLPLPRPDPGQGRVHPVLQVLLQLLQVRLPSDVPHPWGSRSTWAPAARAGGTTGLQARPSPSYFLPHPSPAPATRHSQTPAQCVRRRYHLPGIPDLDCVNEPRVGGKDNEGLAKYVSVSAPTRLLHLQHLGGIWSGLTLYSSLD